jgi:hypothetical protein
MCVKVLVSGSSTHLKENQDALGENDLENHALETPGCFINGSRHTDENTLERLILSVVKGGPHERISKNGPTGH